MNLPKILNCIKSEEFTILRETVYFQCGSVVSSSYSFRTTLKNILYTIMENRN